MVAPSNGEVRQDCSKSRPTRDITRLCKIFIPRFLHPSSGLTVASQELGSAL